MRPLKNEQKTSKREKRAVEGVRECFHGDWLQWMMCLDHMIGRNDTGDSRETDRNNSILAFGAA
jgi:hypothetical protein